MYLTVSFLILMCARALQKSSLSLVAFALYLSFAGAHTHTQAQAREAHMHSFIFYLFSLMPQRTAFNAEGRCRSLVRSTVVTNLKQ